MEEDGDREVVPLDGPTACIVVDRPPGTAGIYARALLRAPRRRQGALSGRPGRILVRRAGVRLDEAKVALFRKVCGYEEGHVVPLTYPEALFLGLMAEGVLSAGFPLSPLGLIHVRQRIAQQRPVAIDEWMDLECRLAELRRSPRGYEVDFSMKVEAGDGTPWSGIATLLSRSAGTRKRRKDARMSEEPPGDEGWKVATVRVPGNTGRRYAEASDDYNPHHLYTFTARLFGYRRPIAHGMWSLARTLAHVEAGRGLAGRVDVDVSFKKPVLMPATVKVRYREHDGRVEFDMRDARKGEPHVLGRLG